MLRKLSWDSPSRGGCPNCPSPASTPNLYPDGKNFPGATNGILPPNPQITSMFYSNGWMLSTDDKNFPVALMGFSHQSCDLQFAPTLTLPSPRCHDNKQRKTLLHFDMEVCTSCDLFLKSYISFRTWWSRSCPIRTTWSSSSWSSSSLWLSTGCFFVFEKKEYLKDCWFSNAD